MPAKNNAFYHPAMAVLIGLVLLSIVVFLGVLTSNAVKEGRYIGRPETERDTITITGEGRVTAIPDIGQITVSIVTKGLDAAKAQEENVTQFNKVVDGLKGEGIDKKDLKTTGYNVYPIYDWVDGERVDKGFEVRQSLQVKIRDTENAGVAIRVASQNGVNEVSGLNFTVDDPEEYRQQARVEALENAREKADELAGLMDVSLGKIVSFSEGLDGYFPTPVYREAYVLSDEGMGGGGAEPKFEAGSEEIVVTATIVYEIY